MFKKAKRKIVISILAILCTVLVGTLSMIYLSSHLSVSAQNHKVLEKHAEMIIAAAESGQNIGAYGKIPAIGDAQTQGRFQHHLKTGTFYTVKISANGNAAVIENGIYGIYTDEELIELAEDVSTEKRGRIDDLLYITTVKNTDTFVSFMDDTAFTESFARLFFFTLLFGMIALISISFISVRIANRIISPMEETYKKQKQFTADAGHELKTPIAAISANAELLHREIGENKWLDNVIYENERMRDLVTELLELARNENRVPERKTVDLSRLINSVILPLEATAFEKNILISSNIAEGISANVDEKSIRRLVTILLDNALSHAGFSDGEAATVYVALEEVKGAAVLSVSNPGEEIHEGERANLFERFYRADDSHEFTGHYGLGLAIAKAISDANGAKISVTCQNGLVVFTVLFPSR